MPHALRVYKALRAASIQDDHSLAVADVVAAAKTPPGLYNQEEVVDGLCEAGMTEELAEAVSRALSHVFPSERFSSHFAVGQLKTNLVRSGWAASSAQAFLEAIEPCVTSPRTMEIRKPVLHAPGPGKVVMCDFTHLSKPEMQKERRAIVVSARSANAPGRCVVVPVSKTPSKHPNQYHYRFEPRSYPFFHQTEPVWAVCDHIYTVSLSRLWQVNINRVPRIPEISDDDLRGIRGMLGTACGTSTLTVAAPSGTDAKPAGEETHQPTEGGPGR